MQGYSDYIYEDGTDWLVRETWHAITSTNVFDPQRYWYANGKPSRSEIASVSFDRQNLSGCNANYLEYDWHGNASFVGWDGNGGTFPGRVF